MELTGKWLSVNQSFDKAPYFLSKTFTQLGIISRPFLVFILEHVLSRLKFLKKKFQLRNFSVSPDSFVQIISETFFSPYIIF